MICFSRAVIWLCIFVVRAHGVCEFDACDDGEDCLTVDGRFRCVNTGARKPGRGAIRTVEQNLIEDIFHDYNKQARPVIDPDESAQIYLSLAISKLDDLNLKSEKLVTTGWTTVTWSDKRLTWDPDAYSGIDVISVSPRMVWLPSFTLDNTLSEDVYTEEHYTLFRVTIDSDGMCMWEPGGHFISKCAVNVRYYPFDKQTCSLNFANWVFAGNKVNLSLAEDAEDKLLQVYAKNGEWDVVEHQLRRLEFVFECCPEFYPEVHFVLHFQRKPLYYVINVVTPSIMLSLLVLMVFRLPPESGEKMSLGVTLLLSYSVFLLMVSDNVPNTSQAVPLIVVYLIFSMGITCISVVIQVAVLFAHHNKKPTRPPRLLRRLVAKVYPTNRVVPEDDGNENYNNILGNGNAVKTTEVPYPRATIRTAMADSGDRELAAKVQSIVNELELYKQRCEKENKQQTINAEWKLVATTIDYACFWVLLVCIGLGASVILFIMPAIQ